MNNFVWNMFVQGIGFLAMACIMITYIRNTRFSMQLILAIGSVLFAIHYALLGAYTGAVVSLIVAVRCAIYQRNGNRLWAVFFMIIFGISGIATWVNIYSIFPTLGSILFSFAFFLKQPKHIRLFSIIPSTLWLIYGIIVNSYSGILSEVFCLGMILIGYFMHDYKHEANTNSEQCETGGI